MTATPPWTRLAALALLVERGKAEVVDEGSGGASFGHAYADHNAYRVVVSTKQDLDAHNLEPRELAEAMATAWMERAQALGAQPTCAAVPGEWCRAVHAGERDAGGWVHPGRDALAGHVDDWKITPPRTDSWYNSLTGIGSQPRTDRYAILMRTDIPTDAGWVGEQVTLLSGDTVGLVRLHGGFPYGVVQALHGSMMVVVRVPG